MLLGKDRMLSWSAGEGALLECLSDACGRDVPVAAADTAAALRPGTCTALE